MVERSQLLDCFNCRSLNEADSRFCHLCGEPLIDTSIQSSSLEGDEEFRSAETLISDEAVQESELTKLIKEEVSRSAKPSQKASVFDVIGCVATMLLDAGEHVMMLSVPIFFIGMPLALGLTFFAPEWIIAFGMRPKQLGIAIFALSLFLVCFGGWMHQMRAMLRDADWRSFKGVVTIVGMTAGLTVMAILCFLGSFGPPDSSFPAGRWHP